MILQRRGALPPEQQQALITDAIRLAEALPWRPNPGSQTEVYFSPADITGYGGEAGPGKTALLVGLALTRHERTLFLRRTNKEARRISEAFFKVVGAGFTDQVQHLRFSRKASAGVLKPRHFLGVELMAQVSSSISRAL